MGKKILIVEDECITSFELEAKIENWGYSVVGIAISGLEALKLVEELDPDLIIMDIKLDGIENGVDVMEKIQLTKEIPFIYLTAHSSDSLMEKAHKTEPYAYIIKPFDDMELKFAIELAFHKYEFEKKLTETYGKINELMDNLMVGVFITDTNGNIIYKNQFLNDIIYNKSLNEPKANKKENDARSYLQKHLNSEKFLDKLKKDVYIKDMPLTILKQNKEIKIKLSAKLQNNMIYGVVSC